MPANERTPLLSDAQSMAQQAKPDLLHIAKILGALQVGWLHRSERNSPMYVC